MAIQCLGHGLRGHQHRLPRQRSGRRARHLATNADQSRRFTTFALAGLLGAVAIPLVPRAQRTALSNYPVAAPAEAATAVAADG